LFGDGTIFFSPISAYFFLLVKGNRGICGFFSIVVVVVC
jgi:hypothetical protein